MNREQILGEIITAVRATSPNIKLEDVTEDMTLADLELDSIKLVELSVRIEELFGDKVDLDTWIDEGAEAGYHSLTVGSLISFVKGRIQAT